MKLRLFCAALALAALLAGCSKPATVDPQPVPNSPPAPLTVHVSIPDSVGAYREAMGPGLVVQGHTSLAQARVELRVGGKTIQSETVAAKDGGPGYWGLVWPAPAETNAEVVLINPADGKELARGPVSPDLFVGLFHTSTFTGTLVDAKAASRSTLRVAGKVTLGERVRVEFRDSAGKLYSTEDVKVNQGAFSADLAWPDGSHVLHFYTVDEKARSQTLGLIIPVVAR